MKNDAPNPMFSPPPPPPPPPSKSNSKRAAVVPAPASTEHSCNPIREIFWNIHHLFGNNPTNIVSFLKPLKPVLQDGPCCGLVALSMASQIFGKDVGVNEIFSAANNSGFTNKGEMFSAYNMATLSASLLDCKSIVKSDLIQNKSEFLRNLANGWPVLIPYDADKNHEPYLNRGQNAHWAVLCGLCFSVSKDGFSLLEGCSTTFGFPYFYHLSCSSLTEKLLNFATKICVYAYQGRSKHLALWDFDTLLLSNNNLHEVANKFYYENMVIPNTGLSELNNKGVILKPKN